MLMKKGSKILSAVALTGLVVLASSCNRGTGCPNNFKLGQSLEQVFQMLIAIF